MTKGDKILIVVLVVLSITSFFGFRTLFAGQGKIASIQVDGEEIMRLTFDSGLVGKTYPIRTSFGYNLLEVGDGRIRAIDADCPDKLDVKQGWISMPGEIIVCLPNRLVVEVIGENPEQTVIDHINY